ncbi:unnamed protein product, partial [Ectocarpus sp. 12 AP-2014]
FGVRQERRIRAGLLQAKAQPLRRDREPVRRRRGHEKRLIDARGVQHRQQQARRGLGSRCFEGHSDRLHRCWELSVGLGCPHGSRGVGGDVHHPGRQSQRH